MKRILFIAPQPFFEVRGTPIAIKDMLTILSNSFDIDLVTYPLGVKQPITNVKHFKCFSFGFKSVSIGPSVKKIFLDISLFFTALRLVVFRKYDYIHAVEEAAFFGVILKLIGRAKLVYDMDSIMSEQISRSRYKKITFIFKFLDRVIIRNSDLILAVSPNFRLYCESIKKNCNFVEIFDIPQIKKAVIPEEYVKLFEGNKKKILYIGNGEKYQGVSLILETSKLLPDYVFYIIGTGKNGREGNIQYISKIPMDYVWGFMQLSDILISPRIGGTNTPMKIYTYMASGKPIVATDIPAHEVIMDCAYITKKDLADIKEKIIMATCDNNDFGSKAKKKVHDFFSYIKLRDIILKNY